MGSGYSWNFDRGTWDRDVPKLDVTSPGDYGADPLGEIDGELRWRMVPSGDVVGRDEMRRRLDARTKGGAK